MLEEYKKLYLDNANATIKEEWKTIDINQVWRNCNGDANSKWFSALVVRYWGTIDMLYYQSQPFFNVYDVYDWYIESLLYTIERHVWDDPTKKLYQDPKGPDKAFHVYVKTCRLTAFQQANTYKRKANATYYSTEDYLDFSELAADYVESVAFDESISKIQFYETVVKLYNEKDYFQALVLDAILSYDFITVPNIKGEDSDTSYRFSRDKLVKFLKHYNDFNIEQFSLNYNIDEEDLRNNLHYVTDKSIKELADKLDRLLFRYKKEMKSHAD